MREIKFRAWDKINKVMLYPINNKNTAILVGGNKVENLTNYINHDTIMQFTGLKDKNGKEIYEGDIVKYAGSMSVRTKDEADNPIQEIFWNNRLSCFNRPAGISEDWEVIGNIYENLELLESK